MDRNRVERVMKVRTVMVQVEPTQLVKMRLRWPRRATRKPARTVPYASSNPAGSHNILARLSIHKT